MSTEKRAAEARRVEMQRQAVGDALRALAGGLPMAGHELPERLRPLAVCAADVSIACPQWHRPSPAFKPQGAQA